MLNKKYRDNIYNILSQPKIIIQNGNYKRPIGKNDKRLGENRQ
jgi:hypothetical protein